MFQGTGSGVGKSLITAGLCRLLHRRGVRVAPFKSQNMALNAGVTADGLEMGRAQILQAEAAGLAPDVRMNPILLKPQGQSCSQLVRRSSRKNRPRSHNRKSRNNRRKSSWMSPRLRVRQVLILIMNR